VPEEEVLEGGAAAVEEAAVVGVVFRLHLVVRKEFERLSLRKRS
jgi:hypothetical protein